MRLCTPQGQEVNWLSGGTSQPLCQVRRFLLNRLSFDDAVATLKQIAGQKVGSADALWRFAQEQARQEEARIAQEIAASGDQPLPAYEAAANVYCAQAKEFVVYTDGICVKAQKPTRQKLGQPKQSKPDKRHDTDVLLLPRKDGRPFYVCEGISDTWTLVQAAQSFLRTEYSGQTLSVVALSDGAKSIRQDLADLFGSGVRVLLDWYHLSKRVYQALSLSAHGKQERANWQQEVLGHLWRGRVSQALSFLAGLQPRNGQALADLMGYIAKHAEEIIDYQLRKQAGKPIGSGPAEKAVDQVVGMRQKDQGMSWTKAGSRALALLKVAELNARPLAA